MPSPLINPTGLQRLYTAGHSLREIAARAGTSRQTIHVILQRLGTVFRTRGGAPLLDSAAILQRYDDGESQKSIAEDLGVDQSTISRVVTR